MNVRASVPASQSELQIDRIIKYIDRLIGNGSLQPGDAVSEPDIGAALGVGRVPVREAIRILAGEGLLELAPYRSARVRMVDAKEILEILEVLTSLSVTAIHRLTAHPMDKALIEKIVESGEKVVVSGKQNDPIEIMRQISLFHNIIIVACGNSYLLDTVRRTRINHYIRRVVEILGLHALKEAAPRYRKIASRIAQQDGAGASRILLRSVDRASSYAAMHPLSPDAK